MMSAYIILGDSTCDLNREIRAKYDIDYLKMNFVMDGKEYPASLDWEELGVHDFYNAMREGKRITTTQVPAETFLEKFTACAKEGKDVLYVGCSSALSGSVNTANVAAKEVMEQFPETKIICVDARNSSFGQGILLIKASDLRKEGKTIEETADNLVKNRNRVNQCGTVADLSYLRRAGRVTAGSAFFGNLIGIKPILISDASGQNLAIKKAKGAQKAKEEIVGYLKDVGENLNEQTLYISHADDEQSAQILAAMLREQTGCKDVFMDYIGPIVGASVGPGTIIAYCVGKEETRVGEA